ncbi:MAG: M48 family metalloprotease [Caulobacterales bacterium]|nr:M48 family metalloprotease [Caulobacterales bacterium]MCA0371583.1 M48 family metalloprotease [Pseudomonadota bacterium]
MAFDIEKATQAYLATLPQDVVTRSTGYTNGGHWVLLFDFIISLLACYLIVKWGYLEKIGLRLEAKRPRPLLKSFLIPLVFLFIQTIITLPWTIFTSYHREHFYGLSKQPFGDWFGQFALSTLIGNFIFALAFIGIYALLRRFKKTWWIWSSLAGGVFALIALILSPIFIEPLFNKYQPFPEGVVKNAIVELAVQSKVPTDKIYVFDGSRQRSVVTANVSGAFGTARLAVSDMALQKTSLAETRAVVGHEIGHYALKHTLKLVVFVTILMLIAFYAGQKLFLPFAKAFGLKDAEIDNPVAIGVLIACFSTIFFIFTPVNNSALRLVEIESDNYSLMSAKEPDGLATALLKTAEYRKANPSKLEEIMFYDHTSVENRVRNAMKWKSEHTN